jgi:DnaJ-class molecular chaperone
MSENYYHILGISEKSTHDEIKKAYRGLQMKYHPDKNQGSPESIAMTQQINKAYETLGDEQQRKEYDMHRLPFNNMNFNQTMDIPIDDILKMFFGGGNPNVHIFQGSPMSKPPPIIKTIVINISQILSGSSVPVDIERWIIENELKVFETETIYVSIPQGVDENEIIILRDKGNVLNDHIKGVVKLFIKIENKTEFKRQGLDLILEKTITLKEALCGFSFEIKFLNGKSYTLNNNKGTIITPGYKKTYEHLGLIRGEHTGNMIIIFNIVFPEILTETQIQQISAIL